MEVAVQAVPLYCTLMPFLLDSRIGLEQVLFDALAETPKLPLLEALMDPVMYPNVADTFAFAAWTLAVVPDP